MSADMPQPLSKVSPRPELALGAEAFKHAPGLSVSIIEVISAWSAIDARITGILAQMMKTDYEAAAAMYRSLTGGAARRAALDSVAAHALAGPTFCLLQAILKVTKPSRDERNDFAHHIWGCDKSIPDALVLMHPDVLTSFEIDHRSHIEARGLSRHKVVMEDGKQIVLVRKPPDWDHSQIAVWRKGDFERAVTAAHDAKRYFDYFWITLVNCDEREQRRKQLFDVPAIEQAFEVLSRKNDQAALLRQRLQRPPRTE